jgi:Holliday junction resolvase
MKSEKTIQDSIIRYLKTVPNLWFTKVVAAPRAMGRKGIPDILCCYHAYFLAFEIKTEKGKLSMHQSIEITKIGKANGLAYIVRSKEEVVDIITHIQAE